MSGDYEISDDLSRFDFDIVCPWILSTYWGRGRSRVRIVRSFEYSISVGAFLGKQQVGCARATSDRAFFAYLGDVFVAPEHRGRGLAQRMTSALLEHPELRDISQWWLRTRDAHGVYERFGFVATDEPGRFMRRERPEPLD